MKTTTLILLLALSCNGHKTGSQNEIAIPEWLIGQWSNSGCSNLNNTIFIEFCPSHLLIKDNIFMEYENIMNTHHNKEVTCAERADYWGVFFADGTDTTSYEFQLTSFGDKKALLWHFNSSEKEKGFFSNSANVILQPLK